MLQELNNTELQEINGGDQTCHDAGVYCRNILEGVLLIASFGSLALVF